MYVVCAELNASIWAMLDRAGVDLRAAIVSAYANSPVEPIAMRLAERLALAELAGYLSVLQDYQGDSLRMNTGGWRPPNLFAKAAAWFRRKVDDASAVPVQFEIVEKAQRRAADLAPAAHLDTAARLLKHVESRRASGAPDEDTRAEIRAALLDLSLDPSKRPAVESEPIREELQVALSRTRHSILSLDFYRVAYPFWRYSSVLDDRTTEGCRALDGLTMPAKDERWLGFVPPRHWRCRAHLLAVVHSVGAQAKKTAPDEQYSGVGTFATLNEEWEPRPGNYPEDLWEIYAASKGIVSPHIELDGPWWRKGYEAP